MTNRFFFNRRSGFDRRKGREQRENPRLDLSHKRRRRTDERRDGDRSSMSFSSSQFSQQSDAGNPPRKH